MLQAAVGDGLSLDPLPFCQDGGAAPEVDVGGGEIVDALVVAKAQQDAVLERLMPSLDFALGHRMIGRTANVLDAPIAQPFGQVAGD